MSDQQKRIEQKLLNAIENAKGNVELGPALQNYHAFVVSVSISINGLPSSRNTAKSDAD